jgi:hypothetical protein
LRNEYVFIHERFGSWNLEQFDDFKGWTEQKTVITDEDFIVTC